MAGRISRTLYIISKPIIAYRNLLDYYASQATITDRENIVHLRSNGEV